MTLKMLKQVRCCAGASCVALNLYFGLLLVVLAARC
jgi:hypothetical protein